MLYTIMKLKVDLEKVMYKVSHIPWNHPNII
jgi:hypothetical protein